MTEDTDINETGAEPNPWDALCTVDFREPRPSAPYLGSLSADAIDRLTKLGADATTPTVIQVPTDGLAPGLPPKVPLLWDRSRQEPISLVDILEEARPPLERVGTARVETLDSFVDLTNRHKDDGSAIFACTSWPTPKLTAVIDYHQADHAARRGTHRVEYAFPLTEEFKSWIQGDGKAMNQMAFAAFIEEHAAELASPMAGEVNEYEPLFKTRFASPNELIDLSRSLEVYENAQVKQGVRLASGERQVVFTTEHTNAKGEPVEIPGLFIVSVAPFVAGSAEGERVRIPARIRYRIKNQQIEWFYQLYRWEFWLRERVQADMAVAVKRTDLPAFEGAPEMAA